ncbi:MAG TPA: hypothetical protein VGP48_06985 [Stellaceae bacterium]|jgi:hypothetical protein|nr:hypothetical protein [Stellaceae bacterium]
MVPHRLMPALLALGLLAMGAGAASAQTARMIAQGASAFPCPSGDASCGNGVKTGSQNPAKQKHPNGAAQNSLPDSNPDQKIEDAPSGEVDKGVTQDLQEMNREGGEHPVNRPK